MNADARGWWRIAGVMRQWLTMMSVLLASASCLHGNVPLIEIQFERGENVRLFNGAKIISSPSGGVLQCTNNLQYAEVDFAKKLDGATAVTIGGWFFPRRSGEQCFLSRGLPEIGANGERFFRRSERWVNFLLGTDQRGFFMGTINGNGTMPFPYLSIHEVPINSWSQLVVTKDGKGHHRLYRNGVLVQDDLKSASGGKTWPFVDEEDGEPLRISMPMGGLVGEVWVDGRELSAREIAKDFEEHKATYHPALRAERIDLCEMNAYPSASLRTNGVTKDNWPAHRKRIAIGMEQVFGAMPKEKVPLEPMIISEVDCGSHIRRKVTIQVQADDWMPAYLLIPKNLKLRVPAIICFYGTTSGAGKETAVGLSGGRPGSPPEKNRAFAVDMAEAGFVVFAPDYLRDGERIKPGERPYETKSFYEQWPEWSVHGKDVWDTSRAIDYLQSLDFVDPKRIGMTGHSYGGHSTIFCSAMDDRIKVAVANGPVSDFRGHGLHWAVPKGASNSQSLPAMRPFVLDHTLEIPVEFYEITAMIAPRPLLVGQAAGERRPMEEENHAAVSHVYSSLGAREKVKYLWYAGDHDYPPVMRRAAIEWFRRWFSMEPRMHADERR